MVGLGEVAALVPGDAMTERAVVGAWIEHVPRIRSSQDGPWMGAPFRADEG